MGVPLFIIHLRLGSSLNHPAIGVSPFFGNPHLVICSGVFKPSDRPSFMETTKISPHLFSSTRASGHTSSPTRISPGSRIGASLFSLAILICQYSELAGGASDQKSGFQVAFHEATGKVNIKVQLSDRRVFNR